MSPNIYSIQNKTKMEKGEEAAEVGTEAVLFFTPGEQVPEENRQQQQQQQIKIVLHRAGSGEDAASPEDLDSATNGLAKIRLNYEDGDLNTSLDGGHLGDNDTEACEKSGEDEASTLSSSGIDDENPGNEIAQTIVSQVEFMFSDEHLAKDGFILKHIRRRSDGFVSLKLVAGLRKVKQITRDFPVILNALKDSSKLEINSDGTKLRRVEPLTPFLQSVPIKDKKKGCKDDKAGSSNDENNDDNDATSHKKSKSPSKSGNKENGNKQVKGNQHPHSSKSPKSSRNSSRSNSRNNSRRNSGIPPSALQQQHPADLFQNVYMSVYYPSGEDSQWRRRGDSLPIAALECPSQAPGVYLSPNAYPVNGAPIIVPHGGRPKSNSYCEGASPSEMSLWLQRRRASASSNGEVTFNRVIRQPRGPDGTKGFATGYRAMILKERLEREQDSDISEEI